MPKTKISKKQPRFSTKGLTKHKPDDELLSDPKITREALVDALIHNDLETFREVLSAHLKASSKVGISKKTGLGRQTLYDLIDPKKDFNPTLKTLGAIFETLAA